MTAADAQAALTAALDGNAALAGLLAARLNRAGWQVARKPVGAQLHRGPEEAFAARTSDAGGGHLDWTGYRTVEGYPRYSVERGRLITAAQLAWSISRNRPPEGQIRADCDHVGCVAPAHLTDRRDREVGRAVLGGAA